uniref:Pectinesterase inhibitor domain-containing protein n=1 Tax=Oryza punctata TaxID=4537 RepID=A0A0E0JD91_ORYPU
MTSTTMVLVVVLSIWMIVPVAMADSGFISTTCNKTHNTNCVAVLTANPDSADASTVSDLAGVALDLAVAAASDAGAVINDRSSRYGGTPEGDALRVCSGAYFDAANDLDIDARDSLGSGDYATASRLVSGAGGAADTCKAAFSAAKVSSVMADINQKMKDRCNIARDLIDRLITPNPK